MQDVTWSYGGIDVHVHKEVKRVHVGALLAGLLLVLAAPLSAAGWALVHFWPLSVPVWLLAAALFWTIAIATARDEPTA